MFTCVDHSTDSKTAVGTMLRIKAVAVLVLIGAVLPIKSNSQGLYVKIFFVDLSGRNVDDKFYACGNAGLAGPFMSGGTAIKWRNEFLQSDDFNLIKSAWNTDPDVCSTNPWFHDTEWHQ